MTTAAGITRLRAGADAVGARARLVRHAQASWGSADYDRLSELGHTQSQHLARWLAADPVEYKHVIRGSLRRHLQTLDIVSAAFAAAGRALPTARVDPDWNEFDHEPVLRAYAAAHPHDQHVPLARAGDTLALRNLLGSALQAWRDGKLDAQVPETWNAFGERVARARERIAGAPGTVLIITSGGVMWRCAQAALDLDDAGLIAANLSLRNTAISEFERVAERWRMLSWNELPHLAASEHAHLHSHF